jgi:hypothetical protein
MQLALLSLGASHGRNWELLADPKRDLGLARRTSSEWSEEELSEQLQEADHDGTKLTDHCVGASPDEIFGRDSARRRSADCIMPDRGRLSMSSHEGVPDLATGDPRPSSSVTAC